MAPPMDAAEIVRAAGVLRAGGLVAFPTETVYGLGADASSADAVAKIYAAKGRPTDHPLIVHLAEVAMVDQWAVTVSREARALAAAFWPGPMTLIMKRAAHVIDAVTGGQDTVGIRVPSHPVAHALLKAFGGGVAAPSANRFGRVSATTAAHVRSEFGDAVDCVLDGGESDVGIESTIIDVSGARVSVLRPGCITVADVERVLGAPVGLPAPEAPRASGTLAQHYAPRTPLLLLEADLVIELAASLSRQGRRVAVLTRSARQPILDNVVWKSAPADPAGFAHVLYACLRELDDAGCDTMLVEEPPLALEWIAVRDRLQRAAAGSQVTAD
jgi:L-threonylcarbamoyladenylate synthase